MRGRGAWFGSLLPLLGCGGEPLDDELTQDEGETADVDPSAPTVGFLTLNLHCLSTDGTPFSDNRARFQAVAREVVARDVSVLALQEVCTREGEDAMDLMATALQEESGLDWGQVWTQVHMAWEGTEDEALEGLGLFARGGLTGASTVEYAVQGSLHRAGLAALVTTPLGPMQVLVIHLDHRDGEARLHQARTSGMAALVDAGEAGAVATVVLGDLNARMASDAWLAMEELGFLDFSGPLSATRIDHVFVHRGSSLEPLAGATLFTEESGPVVSDHPGILVVVGAGEGEDPLETGLEVEVSLQEGQWLSVRGDTSPLDWDHGWPLRALGGGRWRAVFTELPEGTFRYKVLLDDTDWQAGADVEGRAGEENRTSPTFEGW